MAALPPLPARTNAPARKPWVEAIHAYVAGKASDGGKPPRAKLSANENPLGCSPAALAARNAAGDPARYPDPDCTALRTALGAAHAIDPARIVCGTGSGELLGLIVQGYAGPDDEVVFSRFSFSLYEIIARRCGAHPVEVPDCDYGADVTAILAAVTPRTRVVLLANPNNPTGTYLPAEEVARLHAGIPVDVVFVIDQAYAEYLAPGIDDGGLALAAVHDNVLVTRTFSKIHGLAGERVGWATGAPALISTLNRIRGAFNVSSGAQAAALGALGDSGFVEHARAHNTAVRERFTADLTALGNHGLRVIPSAANFVLVVFEGALSGQAAYEGLTARGLITRWLPQQGLGHAVRITIGTQAEMDAVAEALRELAEAAR